MMHQAVLRPHAHQMRGGCMHLAQQQHVVRISVGRPVQQDSCSPSMRPVGPMLCSLKTVCGIFWCRLLASKQAEQQRVLRKETHGLQQHVHQQRQQRSGPGRLQADQDGPGDTRPHGPR